MLAELFAPHRPWGFVEMAIAVVVILAVCGLVAVFTRVTGINLPQWVWHVIGIVVAAVVVIWAIRFVAGM
jgi:hypothetical protein